MLTHLGFLFFVRINWYIVNIICWYILVYMYSINIKFGLGFICESVCSSFCSEYYSIIKYIVL